MEMSYTKIGNVLYVISEGIFEGWGGGDQEGGVGEFRKETVSAFVQTSD